MNRQRFLVGLLILVAVTMLPYYFVDLSGARSRKELAALEDEIALGRAKVTKVRELEAQLAERKNQVAAVEKRLISPLEPFAEMERELSALAGRTGLQVRELALQGPEPVKGLPSLVQYTASTELTGSTAGLLQFISLLEQHRLLVEIPNLDLRLSQPPAKPAPNSAPSGSNSRSNTPAATGKVASPAFTPWIPPVVSAPAVFAGADDARSPGNPGSTPASNSAFAQASLPIQTRLVLHFYGKAPGSR